jgi:hypothetical protein
MSERLQRLTEHPAHALANWREIVQEIDSEWNSAKTTEYRVALLHMFKATMDIAEATIVPDDLQTFREAQRKHYHSFIVQEALVGNNICTETLFATTEREIAAGRMSPDDSLRQSAVTAMAAPHLSHAELLVQQHGGGDAGAMQKSGLGQVLKRLARIFG